MSCEGYREMKCERGHTFSRDLYEANQRCPKCNSKAKEAKEYNEVNTDFCSPGAPPRSSK